MKIIYVNCGFSEMNMKAIFVVMNTSSAVVKIRPEKKIQDCTDLNLRPLRYQWNAPPTELTRQLRAGHYAGSY